MKMKERDRENENLEYYQIVQLLSCILKNCFNKFDQSFYFRFKIRKNVFLK